MHIFKEVSSKTCSNISSLAMLLVSSWLHYTVHMTLEARQYLLLTAPADDLQLGLSDLTGAQLPWGQDDGWGQHYTNGKT